MKIVTKSKDETELKLHNVQFFKEETSDSVVSKLMIQDVIMNTAVGTVVDIRNYFDEIIFKGTVSNYLEQDFLNTEVTLLRIECGNLIIGI